MSYARSNDWDRKRKNQSADGYRYAKTSCRRDSPREEYYRGKSARWDKRSETHGYDESSSENHRSRGRFSAHHARTNCNRSLDSTYYKNSHKIFDHQPSISSGQHKLSELISSSSDAEQMEKLLATKMRIEESLASKSSNFIDKEINFQNSSASDLGKSKVIDSNGQNLDLSSKISDFNELGSALPAIRKGDLGMVNYIVNDPSHITYLRSSDTTTLNSPGNVQQKTQKVGGWSLSAMNDVPECSISSSPRSRNDMCLHEQREEILANVSTATKDITVGPPHKQSNDTQNNNDELSRVGQLYQSFLKSRSFGYMLRDKSPKLIGPNPLLDKSALDSHSSDKSTTVDHVLERQMPQPVRVKMEDNGELNTGLTPEHIAANEASQFCKEYSHLLKGPNLLIPPDDLQKLGLGHLSEMNKLINDKRRGDGPESERPVENQDSFLMMNVGALNRNDNVNVNKDTSPFRMSHNSVQGEIINHLAERGCILNNGISHHNYMSPSRSQNSPQLDQSMRPDILRKDNRLLTQSPQAASLQNVSVEAVVEKVVKTVLQNSNVNSILNSSIPSPVEARVDVTKNISESHLSGDPGTSINDANSITSNQMQDVSSKILRLFLIDKQIEELMAEKMKIYSELLSSQGVSQTLFHSWAQDQIQQGNVMSILSNTSNVIPELNRVINHNIQETNPLPNTNTNVIPELNRAVNRNVQEMSPFPNTDAQLSANNNLEETISELYSLKEEFENSSITTSEKVESDSSKPSTVPTDSCCTTAEEVLEETWPKLSIRKDLIDPNLCNLSLLNAQVKISAMSTEDDVNTSCANSTENFGKPSAKREKKKKKSNKKEVEIINLIDDTDDEVINATGVESAALGSLNSKGSYSEDEEYKKDIPAGNVKMSYELEGRTVTCMTITKVKKYPTKVLIVGCKDGCVMGYSLGDRTIILNEKIHNDTIVAVYYTNKHLITGSSDSTVCLFSLKEKVKTQTLSVNAPVQSMDINFGQLIVGTKAGSIYFYTIKQVTSNKKVLISLLPNKKSLPITNSSILAVKLANEGVRRVLIVASRGEQITVRDATSGLSLRSFDWCDTVNCLQLYEETDLVYCGTNTKSVKAVNYVNGENVGDCIMGRSILQIVFLKSIMFVASNDGNIYVYDVENKSLLATVMIISKGIIQCLAIDGKNNVILVASSRGDLQQIPFPSSVTKRIKKLLKIEKNKNQDKNPS